MNILSRCRVKLINYFDSLISKIDLDTELVLANGIITESEEQTLRNKQNEFITVIKEVQKANLDHLESIETDSLTLLDEKSIDAVIFSQYCFLVDKQFDCVDDALGYLVVVDKHLNEDEVEVFRHIIRFNNQEINIGPDNVFFKLMKYEKASGKQQLSFKLEEFDVANPVIRLNSRGYFSFETFSMTDFCIDTILPSARFAFNNIKCLELKSGECKADAVVKTIEAFVNNGSHLGEVNLHFDGSFEPNAFSRLQEIKFKALKSLKLNSKCEFLSRSLFVGLGYLHELSMVIGSDTFIKNEPFIELNDLKTLSLEIIQNKKTYEVKSNLFQGLSNLESLRFTLENFSDPKFTSVAVSHTLDCLNLKYLYLNKFKVDEGFLDHMTNLKELTLINVEQLEAIITKSSKMRSSFAGLSTQK